jgi:hypothetical protein
MKSVNGYRAPRFLIKLPTADAATRKPARVLPDARELLP